jgi:hypothetical protein
MQTVMRREAPVVNELGCDVTRNAIGLYELRIWGKLPIEWIVNLTSGIAGSGGSIERATARKLQRSNWDGTFEFIPGRTVSAPELTDYLLMAKSGGRTVPNVAISLDGYTLKPGGPTRGGLFLEIRALDQSGFLGAFMNRLSFYMLFPDEVIIETNGGKVYDRFWLKSAGGLEPNEAVVDSLRRYLDGLVSA